MATKGRAISTPCSCLDARARALIADAGERCHFWNAPANLSKRDMRAHSALEFRWREVWQRGFTDHRIRVAKDFARHRDYIHRNPVKWRLPAPSNFATLARTTCRAGLGPRRFVTPAAACLFPGDASRARTRLHGDRVSPSRWFCENLRSGVSGFLAPRWRSGCRDRR
jgi:hypothetical protein